MLTWYKFCKKRAILTSKTVVLVHYKQLMQMFMHTRIYFQKLYKKVKVTSKINFKILDSVLGSSVPDKILLCKQVFPLW